MNRHEMRALPIGTKTEEAWRMVDELAPEKADALAAAALRYALTGKNAEGQGVPAFAWNKAKSEIDLLKTRRAANPYGRHGKPNPEPNAEPNAEPNPEPNPEPSSLRIEEGRGKREEEEEKKKKTEENRRPEDSRAHARSTPADSSDFGLSPPSPSSDFARWAWAQKDPVKVALEASGEGANMAPVYGARLAALKKARGGAEGTRAFVEECISFRRELDAGEECRNPGAALVARLKDLSDAANPDEEPSVPGPSRAAAVAPSPPSMIDNCPPSKESLAAFLDSLKKSQAAYCARIHAGGITSLHDPVGAARTAAAVGLS